MKEKPIIFSTPMVQAILQGRKTMTRRVVKPQPTSIIDARKSPNVAFALSAEFEVNGSRTIICPYGQIGDRLWVRETWQHTDCLNINPEDESYGYIYKADNQPWEDLDYWRWKPSIHMPRSASRILLEITNVGVERVQDITEDDAIKEGIKKIHMAEKTVPVYANYLLEGKLGTTNPIHSFDTLWRKINGNESWNTNPWVWVIEFKVLEESK